jgi:hypothetical protein
MAIARVGSRGSGLHTTSAASWQVTPLVTYTVGSVILLYATTDNDSVATSTGTTNRHLSVTDPKGNTWVKVGEYSNGQGAAAAGVTQSLWVCNITTQLETTDLITITLAEAVVDKAATTDGYTVAAGNTLQAVGTPQYAAVNAANGFGSSTISGLTSKERLYFRVGGKEANSTTNITVSSGFSLATSVRSRNNASAVLNRTEYRINTSTGETSNPTFAVVGDTASIFAAFEEVTPSTTLVNNDQGGSYGVIASVANEEARTYGIVAAVANEEARSYSILEAVANEEARSYSILSAVSADFAGTHSIVGAVSNDLADAYGMAGAVSSDSAGAYDVLSTVSADLAGSHAIFATVSQDHAGSYGVLAAVSADLAQGYEVLEPVEMGIFDSGIFDSGIFKMAGAPNPAVSSVQDDFNGGGTELGGVYLPDTAKWSTQQWQGSTLVRHNRVEQRLAAVSGGGNTRITTGPHGGGPETLTKLSLTGSRVFVRLAQRITGPGINAVAQLALADLVNGGAGSSLVIEATTAGNLEWYGANAYVAAPGSNGTTPYVPANHAWLSFSEQGGTIYFQVAPETASNPPIESDWVTLGSVARSALTWDIDSVSPSLATNGDAGGNATTLPTIWDGFNAAANPTYAAVSTLSANFDAVIDTGVW